MYDEKDEEKKPPSIVIQDKRFDRDADSEEEEVEPQAETEPVEEPSPEPVEKPAPFQEETEEFAEETQVMDFPSAEEREAMTEPEDMPMEAPPEGFEDSPEAQHIKMLFEAGLVGYLHGQLQLLLNFAIIYLGRQPNPATGLISKELTKARLAIDMFEFIVTRTGDELQPEDQTNLANVLSGLKMEYAQAMQENPQTPQPQGEA